MKKQKQNFYNHRNRAGQFYIRKQFIHNRAAARLAFSIFLAFALISCFFEAIANLLIK